MNRNQISKMYDRPLTASDRSVLRRLIREEMTRMGYDPRTYADNAHWFGPSKNRKVRQLYRIFMSVAAEHPEWHETKSGVT